MASFSLYEIKFTISCDFAEESVFLDNIRCVLEIPNQFMKDCGLLSHNFFGGSFRRDFSINACNKTIESILKSSFVFKLWITEEGQDIADFYQLDGHKLLLEGVNSVFLEIDCPVIAKFTVSIDRPILDRYYKRLFTPIFVHFGDFTGILDSFSEKLNHYLCIQCSYLKEKVYFVPVLINSKASFEVVIIITPSSSLDLSLAFFIVPYFPHFSSFAGSGVIYSGGNSKLSEQVSSSRINLLPQRSFMLPVILSAKDTFYMRVRIIESCPFFCISRNHFQSNDPTEDRFARWILSSPVNGESAFYFSRLSTAIFNANTQVELSQQDISIADYFSGFHIITPNEHLYVIETRMTNPNNCSKILVDLCLDAPHCIQIIANTHNLYLSPRLFNFFLKNILIPVNINELQQLHGMYLRKSSLFPLCKTINQLADLCSNISTELPSSESILELESKIPEISVAPVAVFLPPIRSTSIPIPPKQMIKNPIRLTIHSPRRVIAIKTKPYPNVQSESLPPFAPRAPHSSDSIRSNPRNIRDLFPEHD